MELQTPNSALATRGHLENNSVDGRSLSVFQIKQNYFKYFISVYKSFPIVIIPKELLSSEFLGHLPPAALISALNHSPPIIAI